MFLISTASPELDSTTSAKGSLAWAKFQSRWWVGCKHLSQTNKPINAAARMSAGTRRFFQKKNVTSGMPTPSDHVIAFPSQPGMLSSRLAAQAMHQIQTEMASVHKSSLVVHLSKRLGVEAVLMFDSACDPFCWVASLILRPF